MRGTIAKKYINALMQSCNDEQLKEVQEVLLQLAQAYELVKFQNIIFSPDVTADNKEALVLSLLTTHEVKCINFIKTLAQNDRLGLIPSLLNELNYQISLKYNTFQGEVMSNAPVSPEQLKTMEENFSKKFNATIQLRLSQKPYPGIKIALDDLGVEVSFSSERLKAQMSEHILKAI